VKKAYTEYEITLDENVILGKLVFEKCVSINNSTVKGECFFGAFSYAGNDCEFYNASVGRYCSIGKKVNIGPGVHDIAAITSHPFPISGVGALKNFDSYNKIKKQNKYDGNQKRTYVGNDVFIGDNVIIQKGVTIGDGAVIGSGAVVTKDVLPYQIVGGIPAKPLKMRFDEEVWKKLLDIKWWKFNLEKLNGDYFKSPELFFANVDINSLEEFSPERYRYDSKSKSFSKIDSMENLDDLLVTKRISKTPKVLDEYDMEIINFLTELDSTHKDHIDIE